MRLGFTAFETLLATAVLSVIAIATSAALTAGRQQTTNAQDSMYASFLATQLMEEITRLQAVTGSLGPGYGEYTRSQYNGQDDYHGYSDGVGTGTTTIADLAGNAYPSQYQVFTRSVTLSPVTIAPAGWGKTINGYLATVTVSRGGKVCAVVEQYLTP